jgi:organic radical activating enzyme
MTYSVKEIYYTLQGEGTHTGLRFAGCNLWSGREEHRAEAVCRFCDTEFVGTDGVGGGKFETAAELADVVRRAWPEVAGSVPYVVCTGGEPLLQVDDDLISALHAAGFEIGVESNGTLAAPDRKPEGICAGRADVRAGVETGISTVRTRGTAREFCGDGL